MPVLGKSRLWGYLPTDFGPWVTLRMSHDRFRTDGLWTEVAALPMRPCGRSGAAARAVHRHPRSQSVASGPEAGPRETDGNKKARGIKRHVLTCSLGFVPASLVTASNVHDTQAAGVLLDRKAQHGWR